MYENQSKLSKNAISVLEKRYLKNKITADIDTIEKETVQDLFIRVAEAVGDADKKFHLNHSHYIDQVAVIDNVNETKDKFYSRMTNLEFLPNSPTLMNAGAPLGQLSACFVLPIEDSMEGIFETVKHSAMIHKSGGGTGFSFSRLRESGSIVKSTGGTSSGPISFMNVFNVSTDSVKQGGTRRGANMGLLRVDHPDILEFIKCKEDTSKLNNFNISVGLTKEFMEALKNDTTYDLKSPSSKKVVKSLKARDVYNMIVENAWKTGEPGIIFLDKMNEGNTTPQLGEIETTNPCKSAHCTFM